MGWLCPTCGCENLHEQSICRICRKRADWLTLALYRVSVRPPKTRIQVYGWMLRMFNLALLVLVFVSVFYAVPDLTVPGAVRVIDRSDKLASFSETCQRVFSSRTDSLVHSAEQLAATAAESFDNFCGGCSVRSSNAESLVSLRMTELAEKIRTAMSCLNRQLHRMAIRLNDHFPWLTLPF